MRSSSVADAIRLHGGICHISRLSTDGISADRLQRAAAGGEVTRVRTGWYLASTPHPNLVTAVRAGGAVSCVSALRLRGVWAIESGTLHLRMRRGTGATRDHGVRRHWSDRSIVDPIDPVLEAARCAARCLPLEHAVAVLDSALHLQLVALPELRRDADARMRRIIPLLDARSGSGLESLARVRLRRLRVRVRPQVRIPGVGRVDLLIGDRLILELDGEEFHDFDRDRLRDRRAAVLRYLTIRASYRQVMDDWAALEAQLLVLIRRREHLGRAARGRDTRIPELTTQVPSRASNRVPRPRR
jgi:very-short-patch-repair endonuclease